MELIVERRMRSVALGLNIPAREEALHAGKRLKESKFPRLRQWRNTPREDADDEFHGFIGCDSLPLTGTQRGVKNSATKAILDLVLY
jgi:hypothetical protein